MVRLRLCVQIDTGTGGCRRMTYLARSLDFMHRPSYSHDVHESFSNNYHPFYCSYPGYLSSYEVFKLTQYCKTHIFFSRFGHIGLNFRPIARFYVSVMTVYGSAMHKFTQDKIW